MARARRLCNEISWAYIRARKPFFRYIDAFSDARVCNLLSLITIQQGPGEGHDQYVDDMFTTTDGKCLAVSRPSFADVVWIDVARAIAGRSDSIMREQPMDGHRSDHMGLSPDGRRIVFDGPAGGLSIAAAAPAPG